MPSTFSDYAAQLRDFVPRTLLTGRSTPLATAEFHELAQTLFSLQFAHNPAYRRFCESRRVSPDGIAHWSEIPAIPAAAFKEFELTSLPPGHRQFVFHSSGTTGHRPARHFHDGESLALYELSLMAWFGAQLEPANGSSFISLTPPAEAAPRSSLVHMFHTIHRELGSPDSRFTGRLVADGSWDVDGEATLAVLRHSIAESRPVNLMGTAFNFLQLLDHLNSASIQLNLPAGSRVFETGGYKGRTRALPRAELHSLITKELGIPEALIGGEYGMCELSSQAYDLKAQSPMSKLPVRTFRFPPWARAQIISPETGREVADGETGLIRIFDLANIRSVLAIQTEDLAVRHGDGFELLGRADLAEARGCSLMSI